MTKPATAEKQAPHAIVELIPLDKIAEDPGNPRRTFTGLEELAESVKEHGVLQPITVRSMPGIGSNLLMIVFGARRYRAARLAGLEAIPAIRREMSDAQALEEQLVENLNRPDVHPLEEAEGYERLLHSAEKTYTVEDIAAKVGKSKGYVYARLALLKLSGEARKLFYEDKLRLTTAQRLARIPTPELQRQALKAIEPEPWRQGQPRSEREIADILRDQFMLRMAEAPFPPDDAVLVAGAGPCSTCPKRSGAQPELFGDVSKKDGDLCTDPTCFSKKKAAWSARRVAEAEAAGQKVLSEKEAAQVLRHESTSPNYDSAYIGLDDKNFDDPKQRTWRQILGKDAPVAVARTKGGDLVELVEKKAAVDVLKKKGTKVPYGLEPERRSSRPSGPSMNADRKKALVKRRGIEKAITLIVAKAEKSPLDDEFMVDAVLDLAWHDTSTDIARRRDLEFGKGVRPEEALEKHRRKLAALPNATEALKGLLVETLVTRGAYWGSTDRLRAAAKLYGVDLEKCRAEAVAEAKAKEAEKKTKKKGKPPAKGGSEPCGACGVAADKPSKGCAECDHGRAKSPAKKGKGAARG